MKASTKVLIIIFFIFLSLNFFQRQVKSFFYNFSSPFQEYFWEKGQSFFSFSRTMFQITSFKQEMETLKEENRKLKLENILLKEIEKENIALRQALSLGFNKDFDLILSRVLAKQNNYLTINQGSNHGVEKNSIVITKEKILVGKIVEVYNNQSKVMLITHPESVFNGEILEKDILGLISGKNLDLVSIDKEVEKGDIITSQGFLVGEIISVIRKDTEPFLIINFEPVFTKIDLNYLYIIND